MDDDDDTDMLDRLIILEKRNKDAKCVLDMTKFALKQVKATKDTAYIETCEKIILYYETYIKIHNYEKLMINTILSEKIDNIKKIAPNLRQKYLNSSSEICELHSELVSLGRISGFDEYNYMKTCKKLKNDVKFFTYLCDLASNCVE